jgi:type I restriction enzyme S subunit
MKGWTQVKLKECTEILPGFAFVSENFTENPADIPLVKGENLHQGYIDWESAKRWAASDWNKFSKYQLKENDIVVAMDRPWIESGLKWSWIKSNYPKSLLVQRVSRIRAKGELDQFFLRYVIGGRLFESYIKPIVTGVNVPHISGTQIGNFAFGFPTRPIQKKIAAILSAYDDLIENNNRRIAMLEKMAEELYREWFVRMRFPGHEKVKIIKGVPEGWEVTEAGKYFKLAKGRSYSSDEISDFPISENHLPFINLKNFNRGGGYRPGGIKYYCGKFNDNQIVKGDSIVLAVTDMTQDRAIIGRVARIPVGGFLKGTISCDVTKIIPQNISNHFLYALLRYSSYSQSLKEFANGANVLHLKPDLASTQKILIPCSELRLAFDKIYSPILKKIDACLLSQQNLQTSRDRLLSRLMSGKLDIEKLDIRFPKSMLEAEVMEEVSA